MNFTGKCERTGIQLELKYCERCGGIFLRSPATAVVYCRSCQRRWVKSTDPKDITLRRKNEPLTRIGRISLNRDRKARNERQIENLHGSAMEVLPC
jgi:protein-arginine kinase activator protein McsA